MIKYALALAGAVLVTAGAAHAQTGTTREERAAIRAETPWYERFTYSQGPSEMMTGLGPSDRTSQQAWSLTQRWGVTLDVHQADRLDLTTHRRAADEAAVGAYFQFTPRVRVGGKVSLRDTDTVASPVPAQPDGEEATAGVRLESAFRF